MTTPTPMTFDDFFDATFASQYPQSGVPDGIREVALVTWEARERDLAAAQEALAAAKARAEQNARDADAYKADAEAVRELMNVYNLGGWTDAVAPMKRALLAEKALQAIVTDYVTTDAAEHFHPWLREIVQPIIDKGMAEIAAAIAGEKP